MKVEIEIKTNTVTFYPDQPKKVEESQSIKVSAEASKKVKNTFLKDMLKATIKQILPSKPQHTQITFRPSAYKGMDKHHISKVIVQDIIRYPDYTKDGEVDGKNIQDSRLYKFYSHDLIGIIAPYDPVRKTYTVISVNKWKRGRR